jgi:hypothetical protein
MAAPSRFEGILEGVLIKQHLHPSCIFFGRRNSSSIFLRAFVPMRWAPVEQPENG